MAEPGVVKLKEIASTDRAIIYELIETCSFVDGGRVMAGNVGDILVADRHSGTILCGPFDMADAYSGADAVLNRDAHAMSEGEVLFRLAAVTLCHSYGTSDGAD